MMKNQMNKYGVSYSFKNVNYYYPIYATDEQDAERRLKHVAEIDFIILIVKLKVYMNHVKKYQWSNMSNSYSLYRTINNLPTMLLTNVLVNAPHKAAGPDSNYKYELFSDGKEIGTIHSNDANLFD